MPDAHDGSIRSLLKNRVVATISVNQFIRVFGRSQAWIFLPLYLNEIRHIPFFTIGIVLFVMAFSSVPFGVYGGNLIDRLGRKKMLMISTPIIAALFFLIAISVFFNENVLIFYALLILTEPFMNIQGSADNVIITDSTTPSERTNAFSIVRILLNIGFALGPAVGGFIAGISYGYIFLIPGVLTIIETILYYLYVPETLKKDDVQIKKKGFEFPSKDIGFLFASLTISIMFLVMGQWGTTLTLFWKAFDHISDVEIGLLYGTNGIYVAIFQMPTNKILTKMRDHMRVLLGLNVYAFGFFALIFFRSFPFLLVDVFVLTMGENITAPVISSIISKLAPLNKRGQYFGAFQVIAGVIGPSAPILGTFFIQYFPTNMGILWVVTLIMSLSITILTVLFWERFVKYKDESVLPGEIP
ncbi:MAG: MFS transporter [Thermoplasmataceae archaeon]